METLLRHQWAALRSWLDEIDLDEHGARPSGLAEWTVRDLVVHLGFGIVMLDEVSAAPPDAEPLPVGEYIARYRPAAPIIATATLTLAAELRNALDGIDALASRAWSALDGSLPPVVMGRRGPLTREDFLVTRLLELVVHADDLHRAIAIDTASPVLPEAMTVIAETLAGAYELRAGAPHSQMDLEQWIRLATGRYPSPDPHLPLL
jgi:uncharacterized protein (TIGR03083 family)